MAITHAMCFAGQCFIYLFFVKYKYYSHVYWYLEISSEILMNHFYGWILISWKCLNNIIMCSMYTLSVLAQSTCWIYACAFV